MQEAGQKIVITFQKVKGHSGVEGNEEADRLAKEAVGLV
jgi:ribonuclease HI